MNRIIHFYYPRYDLYTIGDHWAYAILGLWPTHNIFTKVYPNMMYKMCFKELGQVSLTEIMYWEVEEI